MEVYDKILRGRLPAVRLKKVPVKLPLDLRVADAALLLVADDEIVADCIQRKMAQRPVHVRAVSRVIVLREHPPGFLEEDAPRLFVDLCPDPVDAVLKKRIIVKENIRSLQSDMKEIILRLRLRLQLLRQIAKNISSKPFMCVCSRHNH